MQITVAHGQHNILTGSKHGVPIGVISRLLHLHGDRLSGLDDSRGRCYPGIRIRIVLLIGIYKGHQIVPCFHCIFGTPAGSIVEPIAKSAACIAPQLGQAQAVRTVHRLIAGLCTAGVGRLVGGVQGFIHIPLAVAVKVGHGDGLAAHHNIAPIGDRHIHGGLCRIVRHGNLTGKATDITFPVAAVIIGVLSQIAVGFTALIADRLFGAGGCSAGVLGAVYRSSTLLESFL